MQYFDISIAANAARQINAPGRFMRYYSGSAGGADESLLVRFGAMSGAGGVILKPGQSIKLPQAVDSWYLSNFAKAATITGRVVIGMAVLDDDRITGEVSVIDGLKAKTLANDAFVASPYQAAVAAQYSHVELWNPAASGIDVMISQFSVRSATAGVIGVAFHNAALTTLRGAATSKLYGGAAGLSEAREQANGASLGGNSILTFNISANGMQTVILKEPIVLVPSSGLLVRHGTVNADIGANLEFGEESV